MCRKRCPRDLKVRDALLCDGITFHYIFHGFLRVTATHALPIIILFDVLMNLSGKRNQ